MIGTSVKRVDAYDKVTGRAKYTDDLCDKSAYIAKVLHSTIANGYVREIDTSEAEKLPGVIKIVTCFDVPKFLFPTAGHPWSTDPKHQDVCDRLLLTERVRYYGDDIAAVVAIDEITAKKALSLIKVSYEELDFVLDVQQAMEDGAPLIHEDYKNNILGHTEIRRGDFEGAIKEDGLYKIEGWYDTPAVQHCHIEPPICFAEMEAGRIVVTSSTQIPHIVRRIVAQALGLDWGQVRIIKPYLGGGFGNKQDALYEPLCAYLCTCVGGHLVKLETSREETFSSTRVRHSIRSHITTYARADGTFVARRLECFSDQGAYASHGHGVCAKGANSFPQVYPCENLEVDAYTVFTNKAAAGAMRGYGIPQASFAGEAHLDDIAAALGMTPFELRMKNLMPKGYVDSFSKNENYTDAFRDALRAGMEHIDYKRKFEEYKNQSGNLRRGIGMSVFWYNTAVWPISLETSSCRMLMNQDGSIQLQLGETEIGQGADTAFAQMAAETLGIPVNMVHVISTQDTDLTPYGTGAYASRQTYTAGFSIKQTAELLKQRVLNYAHELTRMPAFNLDIIDGKIVRTTDGRQLMTIAELATEALYSLEHSQHFSAESTYQIKSNAYSFGCTIAELEVDIQGCRAKLLDIVNVHDCGRLINPALALAQVHGGMSMGIGYGLSEKLLYDSKTGKLLNGNLLDYKLSTIMDHPELTGLFIENYEPTSAYGTKALGEPPVCSVAPAIRNALLNATGVAINEIPLTPHVLFREFSRAGLLEGGVKNV